MKFEDLLMAPSEEQKKLELKEQIENLKAELDEEVELNKVLHSALQGPVLLQSSSYSFLPCQVQVLLSELAAVEEEIVWLERRINELKMKLYKEKKQTNEQKTQRRLLSEPGSRHRSRSKNHEALRKGKLKSYSRSSIGSATDILSTSSSETVRGESRERSRRLTCRVREEHHVSREIANEKPNTLSEELMRCLINIFLELNQALEGREGSAIIPKLSLSCMNPKAFIARTQFNHNISNIDPYGVSPDFDGIPRDIGPYRNFIQITRQTLDISRFSQCVVAIRKLRVLMHKLSTVDLSFLTYKQKLAFWINIYNACIMHAFLEHGLPSTQEKLLAIMNKAALNVGGIVLNALAIEHFILRHPYESTFGPMDEKEMLLRHAYGLGYPEPNVTFALCRGSWSSPALRVYTSDEVVNELGKARVEYLEASVGVTNKRKVMIPKLLQWHMHDFADDMESLLEWVYSQLPRSGSLKRLIMECLNRETKYTVTKMVEVQPYEFEFRYLLPL